MAAGRSRDQLGKAGWTQKRTAWYTRAWLGHPTGPANAVKRGDFHDLRKCARQGKPVQYRRGPRHCDRGQSSANPLGEEPGKGRTADDPASQETYCVRARGPQFREQRFDLRLRGVRRASVGESAHPC